METKTFRTNSTPSNKQPWLILSKAERSSIRQAKQLLALDKSGFALSVLCGSFGLGSAVGLAATAAWLIAYAAHMPPVISLSMAAVLVRAFGIGKAVFRYAERLCSHSVALRGMASLRTRLYTQIASSNSQQIAAIRRGDLLARTGQDVDAIGDYVIKAVLPAWVATVVGGIATLVLFCLLPSSGLALGICILSAGFISPWLSARSARLAENNVDAAHREISALSLTMLEHAAELKVSGAMPVLEAQLANTETQLHIAKDRAARPLALAIAADNFFMGLAVIASLCLGIPAVASGHLNQVDLAVIVLTPLAAFEASAGLGMAAVQKVRSAAAAARILELLTEHDKANNPLRKSSNGSQKLQLQDSQPLNQLKDETVQFQKMQADLFVKHAGERASSQGQNMFHPEKQARVYTRSFDLEAGLTQTKDTNPEIAVQADLQAAAEAGDLCLKGVNINIGWDSQIPICENLNLEISQGKAIALVGASGVGKSTLLNTLSGLINPLGGTAQLNGYPTASLSRATICAHLAFSAEDAHIFNTTILENLRVARGDLSPQEAQDCLKRAGLNQWVASLPKGIYTELSEDGGSISGGERRRLLAARALAAQANILLLDEPAEHLDQTIGDQLIADLLNLKTQEKGVLLVTHRLSPLHAADEIILLGHPSPALPATIIARGTHTKLLQSNEDYRWALAQETGRNN